MGGEESGRGGEWEGRREGGEWEGRGGGSGWGGKETGEWEGREGVRGGITVSVCWKVACCPVHVSERSVSVPAEKLSKSALKNRKKRETKSKSEAQPPPTSSRTRARECMHTHTVIQSIPYAL